MKKVQDSEAATGGATKTASAFALAIAEQIGKEVVCAEKPAAEAFLQKVKATITAENFSLKEQVEKWGINEVISLFEELTIACGCPDAPPAV